MNFTCWHQVAVSEKSITFFCQLIALRDMTPPSEQFQAAGFYSGFVAVVVYICFLYIINSPKSQNHPFNQQSSQATKNKAHIHVEYLGRLFGCSPTAVLFVSISILSPLVPIHIPASTFPCLLCLCNVLPSGLQVAECPLLITQKCSHFTNVPAGRGKTPPLHFRCFPS